MLDYKTPHPSTPALFAAAMPTVVALLLVAVLPATAFTPPRLFGPPRTRAQALAYAKKAVFKDDNKNPVVAPVPPQTLKGSRQGRVEMMVDPGCVSGARPLSSTKRYCACPASPDDTAPQALSSCPTGSCQSRRRARSPSRS